MGIILPFSEPEASKMGGGRVGITILPFSEPKSFKMVIPPRVAGERGGGGMIELHVSSLHFCPDANLVGMRTDAKLLGMRTPLHTSTYC